MVVADPKQDLRCITWERIIESTVKLHRSHTREITTVFDGPLHDKRFYFHGWHEKGYVPPQCQLRAFEMDKVISTYEALLREIKACVPNQSYHNAKELLEIKEKNALEKEVV